MNPNKYIKCVVGSQESLHSSLFAWLLLGALRRQLRGQLGLGGAVGRRLGEQALQALGLGPNRQAKGTCPLTSASLVVWWLGKRFGGQGWVSHSPNHKLRVNGI